MVSWCGFDLHFLTISSVVHLLTGWQAILNHVPNHTLCCFYLFEFSSLIWFLKFKFKRCPDFSQNTSFKKNFFRMSFEVWKFLGLVYVFNLQFPVFCTFVYYFKNPFLSQYPENILSYIWELPQFFLSSHFGL